MITSVRREWSVQEQEQEFFVIESVNLNTENIMINLVITGGRGQGGKMTRPRVVRQVG